MDIFRIVSFLKNRSGQERMSSFSLGQGNLFGNTLYGRQAFLDYKKVDFWMVAKLDNFLLFLFGQNS